MEKVYLQYLEKKKFTINRIKRSISIVNKYKLWLKSINLEIKEAQYSDLLNYINHLQSKKLKKITINEYIANIGHYYTCLNIPNPTIGLRLIGITHEIKPYFNTSELDKIYTNFTSSQQGSFRHKDRLILGLIIYQALEFKALYNLKTENINLLKGVIHVPATGRNRQERVLKIESHQIMPLNNYIIDKKLKRKDRLLINSYKKEASLKSLLKSLTTKVITQSQAIKLKLENLGHLRQSRYVIWLKQHGIRQAQYMGGFKSIQSIERYKDFDLEILKSDIEKYHPLDK